jgi:hypothetical protein
LEDRIGEGSFGTVYRAKKKGDPGKVRKKIDSKNRNVLCCYIGRIIRNLSTNAVGTNNMHINSVMP